MFGAHPQFFSQISSLRFHSDLHFHAQNQQPCTSTEVGTCGELHYLRWERMVIEQRETKSKKCLRSHPHGPPGRYQKDPSPTVSEGISFVVGFVEVWGIFPRYVGKIIENDIPLPITDPWDWHIYQHLVDFYGINVRKYAMHRSYGLYSLVHDPCYGLL